jgi:CRP/FNR family transcriptional regulator, cyclic AMP receptor protein
MSEVESDAMPNHGFSHFVAGEAIIAQGQMADLVYTLIEGSADALRDGVKVGEIHENEIFGALAVFTGQPRMASVVARTDCTVMMVDKDEFIQLIERQPQVAIGLIEEMASKINDLNNQLLALKK